jgi:hypothetical protein
MNKTGLAGRSRTQMSINLSAPVLWTPGQFANNYEGNLMSSLTVIKTLAD